MKVAVLHNEAVSSQPDSQDVLEEVRLVQAALERLQLSSRAFPMREGWEANRELSRDLAEYAPAVVFNLVENLGADPRRQALAAGWLDLCGWPYTGSGFEAILATTDKTLAKAIFAATQVPTPAWQRYDPGHPQPVTVPGPWIVKPAWEDASVGIDDQAVIHEPGALQAFLARAADRHGSQPLLIEAYIEGREFNLSLLEHSDGRVEVLPPAEICFTDWPGDKPRIVGYRAKWEPETFEYRHTPRSFQVEAELQQELAGLAVECWRVLGASGYARVDIRRNAAGQLFVIELNTNPCIAPDAGFMAAAQQAGCPVHEVIREIIASAKRRKAGTV